MSSATVRAAARRIVLFFGSAIVVIAGASAAVGLALGTPVSRSASTGLYLVGCFFVILGVFAGVRGPLRPAAPDEDLEPMGSLLGVGIFSKGVRQATGEERSDARATAWLFLALGFAMILVGMVVDPRMRVL